MIIVADSSALIALAICEALEVLEGLFGKIAVPQSVYEECTKGDKLASETLAVFLQDKVVQISQNSDLIISKTLGQGELDAMQLYRELEGDYLLIDDLNARKTAQKNQITIIGSLGILLLAKQEQLLNKISPYLEVLAKSPIHFAPDLLEKVKKIANE